ncbi:CAP domain-containing protein [Paraburkholderia kururiensis]|uniref:CAP domain-containing protein n=1 Tax=Paraburkholderia kururiensis TaxID=984307 RepID=UPI000F85F05A|nr:CAP domain-containing protein [Paraburkholderia kururiensis]
MKKNISALTAVAMAAAALLAACGGGSSSGSGGGSTSTGSGSGSSSTGSTPATQTATSGNVPTPQYAATSAQLAAFNLINAQRQQCGFPTLVENTTLDQATAAHAAYMGLNGGTITDSEASGSAGFTGVTYNDRAVHFGYPNGTSSIGVSGGFYTNAKLTETEYGQQIAYDWLSGVYHMSIGVWPTTNIGLGWNETTFNGFPEIQASAMATTLQAMPGTMPLTFPCQGTTGVPYSSGGESPTPPGTSGNWGMPVAVIANPSDTVVLSSASMTDTSSHTVTLQLLDSANDPNKLLPAFEAVAYPASPLSPNTTYTVSITGTINGTNFSRTFTFTTGNIVG